MLLLLRKWTVFLLLMETLAERKRWCACLSWKLWMFYCVQCRKKKNPETKQIKRWNPWHRSFCGIMKTLNYIDLFFFLYIHYILSCGKGMWNNAFSWNEPKKNQLLFLRIIVLRKWSVVRAKDAIDPIYQWKNEKYIWYHHFIKFPFWDGILCAGVKNRF